MKGTLFLVGMLFVVYSFVLMPFAPKESEACDSPSTIAIDIKPGSFTNPLNVNSGGLLPVAVFGSDFNVERIAAGSVVIENEMGFQEPCRWFYEDIDKDRIEDLLILFPTAEVVANLGLDHKKNGETVYLTLTGGLLCGGTFSGQDSVLIMKNKK